VSIAVWHTDLLRPLGRDIEEAAAVPISIPLVPCCGSARSQDSGPVNNDLDSVHHFLVGLPTGLDERRGSRCRGPGMYRDAKRRRRREGADVAGQGWKLAAICEATALVLVLTVPIGETCGRV
jgi:hypothetical protein